MNEKILSMLGMARRAGKLSTGHDAAVGSIVKNKAKLCFIASDASQRLKKELHHACTFGEKNITVIESDFDMATVSKAIGIKAAVITIDDEGFAKKINELA